MTVVRYATSLVGARAAIKLQTDDDDKNASVQNNRVWLYSSNKALPGGDRRGQELNNANKLVALGAVVVLYNEPSIIIAGICLNVFCVIWLRPR